MPWGNAALKKDRLDDEKELLLRLLEKEGLGPVNAQTAEDAATAQLPNSQGTASQGISSQEISSTRPSVSHCPIRRSVSGFWRNWDLWDRRT